MSSRRWSNVTKIIVAAVLAVLLIVLLVLFREMVAPTVVAFLLAFILSYPVNWIQRTTGWARGTTVAALYVVIIALVLVAPALAIPRLAGLGESLLQSLQDLVSDLQSVSAGPILVLGSYQFSVDSLFQETGNTLQNFLVLATSNSMTIARELTTGVLTVVYVLVLNFWLLKDMQKLRRVIVEQIPSEYQQDVSRLGHELGQIWHQFLRGQLVLAMVVGMMTWVALSIVGMPNAGGLSLLAGLMEFLPTIGPGISGAIGTILALFRGSTWMPVGNVTFALIVLAIYVVITQIESVYLIPRLVGGRVKLHPAVTFVGIISGALVFGVLGVLLATPTIASARTLLFYIYRKLLDIEPFDTELTPSLVRIPGLIAGRRVEAIVFELDGTLTQVDWTATELAATQLRWLDRIVSPQTRSRQMHRLMVLLEGFVSFLINQLMRLSNGAYLRRWQPVFDLVRGHPPARELTLVAGSREVLCTLARKYKLVLVSTRPRPEINEFLVAADLQHEPFDLVIAREDVRNLLPRGEALLLVASRLNLAPDTILVVSDTDTNLRSARAAEMTSAGVLNGLGMEQDFRDAELVLASVTDLVEWL